MMTTETEPLKCAFQNGWKKPDRRPASIRASEIVQMPGGAFGDRLDLARSPWNRFPIDQAGGCLARTVTHVKPVQSGGSLAGEAALVLWLKRGKGGDVQVNFESDEKALARWDKRIEKILRASVPDLWPADRMKAKRGLVIFDRSNLTVQGVWSEDNLDSDSIKYQINEEVHNWEPGRLEKAYNRTTAYLDSCVRFNISNASKHGDQLHQAFLAGTQQFWQVKCPGCGLFHMMHSELHKDGRPGGLRYNSEGCKRDDGSYDYNKLVGTIFYEFECGYRLHDDTKQREALSQTGDYSAPTNTGASLLNRSTTLEAVSVHYIPWIELIAQKHSALRAMKLGDPSLFWQYKAERECRFVDPESDRPVLGAVILNTKIKKNRDGLPNREIRFGALDRQQGKLAAGELPHWWGVIRDVDPQGNSLLVWEGKCLTDDDAAAVMADHNVKPTCVVVDSGHDTMHVYRFCLRHGFNAIKGSGNFDFAHDDGTRRIFSPEEELWKVSSANGPVREDPLEEPLFFHYSKAGIRERLYWLRASDVLRWDVPGDVSADYKAHLESEELRERKHPRTGESISEWVQIRKRNDLLVCECYIALMMDMAGFLGACEPSESKAKIYELKESTYEPNK